MCRYIGHVNRGYVSCSAHGLDNWVRTLQCSAGSWFRRRDMCDVQLATISLARCHPGLWLDFHLKISGQVLGQGKSIRYLNCSTACVRCFPLDSVTPNTCGAWSQAEWVELSGHWTPRLNFHSTIFRSCLEHACFNRGYLFLDRIVNRCFVRGAV